MKVIGLTGSIAMGKSVAALMLRQLKIPVWDADQVVHRLLAKHGAAVEKVAAVFPSVLNDQAIDRAALGKIVFQDDIALKKLEQIIHPLVRQSEQQFLKHARMARRKLVVLDIPLLYEQHREKDMDAVMVVTASRLLQRKRALKRTGMTEEKLRFILAKQMPDNAKRRLCDYIVISGLGRAVAKRQIMKMIENN